MDTIIEIAMSTVAGAFGVGSAWMAVKSSIKAVSITTHANGETLNEHGRKLYELLQKISDHKSEHTQKITDHIIEDERLIARVLVLEHDANERANSAERFERKVDKRTDWQDKMLMEIAGRVGVARKSSGGYPPADPRAEDPHGTLPPMRPRFVTKRET